ncbi:MAG: hypothetical protein DCC58_01705 [Chloroflexi bacterium]|nr:MAG: hypothetical protein DCC58_01705 [Chloroflexota bacterium]
MLQFVGWYTDRASLFTASEYAVNSSLPLRTLSRGQHLDGWYINLQVHSLYLLIHVQPRTYSGAMNH